MQPKIRVVVINQASPHAGRAGVVVSVHKHTEYGIRCSVRFNAEEDAIWFEVAELKEVN